MFVLSKLLWFFMRADTLVIMALALSLFLLRDSTSSKLKKLGWRTLATVFSFLMLLSYTSLANLVILPLEQRFPAPSLESLPNSVHGVIVLGGGIQPEMSEKRSRLELNSSGDRVAYLPLFARKYPEAKIVYSTGSGFVTKQAYPEAPMAQRWMQDLGTAQGRVIYESTSRNTYENVVESKKIVQPQANETWLLVTSAFHMPRAVGVFQKQGWSVIPFPVDFRTIPRQGFFSSNGLFQHGETLSLATKEWLGLFAYRIFGRTDSMFPVLQP